jgi:hypothetical protein
MLVRPYVRVAQRVLAFVAAAFGIITVIAGGRVLAGVDPGYVVFRPLVIFNTAMGMAYLAAGVITWRSLQTGKFAAAIIFLVNLFVLVTISYLYTAGGAIAIDSIRAMSVRTAVWLALFLGLVWLARASRNRET